MGREALLALALIFVGCNRREASSEGAALFEGRPPLVARLSGQSTALPPATARCSNCHARESGVDAKGFGPDVFGEALTASRSRRAGPASRFDAASFCKLLRTGVDAADVIIAHEMPRYEVSEAQCAALWTHVTGGR